MERCWTTGGVLKEQIDRIKNKKRCNSYTWLLFNTEWWINATSDLVDGNARISTNRNSDNSASAKAFVMS